MAGIWLPGGSDAAIALRNPERLIPLRKPEHSFGINWRHPAARGLRYVNLLQKAGDNRDLTGNYADDTVIGTVGSMKNEFGSHANFTAAGGLRIWGGAGQTTAMLGSPAAASVLVVASAPNTANRTTLLGDWTPGGLQSNIIVEFSGYNEPTRALSCCFGAVTNGYAKAALNTVDNKVYCAGFTNNGTTMRAWANGIAGTDAAFAGYQSLDLSAFPVIGQGGAFAHLSATAKIYLLMLWNVCVPDRIMLELTRNPYALLASNQSPYFVSAGAAATFPFRIGSTQITSASLGNTPITGVYRGATQIWP